MSQWPDDDEPAHADGLGAMTQFAPPSADLLELARLDGPDSGTDSAQMRPLVPVDPDAPGWMRRARALAEQLERLVARGDVDPSESAAIDRAWLAFHAAEMSERHIMRVARLVSHAHRALRNTTPEKLNVVLSDCASLVRNGLPKVARAQLPHDRVRSVLWEAAQEADSWIAIVRTTSELLGWSDLARGHAAALIRFVIDKDQHR
ncbi:MAG: hypothetical protein KF718_27820 [Polyangiaceae bacterium]|nr:hypothetical protein [Polyangiaceae bacterium]